MNYPLSSEVTPGQPTAAAQYNNLRSDALRLGQQLNESVLLGQFLGRYARGIRLVYLPSNRVRVPYVTTDPPTLMIGGCMCQAAANVDLPAGLFSGGEAAWYVFARRAVNGSFTLEVNTSATEAADTRLIGEVQWDGSAITSIKDLFTSALSDPDYDSGWFAVTVGQTYSRAHGLNQVPKLVVVEHAASSGGTGEIVRVTSCADSVYGRDLLGYDAQYIYITTNTQNANGVVNSTRRSSGSGYLRVRAWR